MAQVKNITFLMGLCALLLICLGAAQVCQAQVISGDVVGVILDKSGSAIPGAKVTAVNAETGVKYETKGNATGEYRFNNLPVGTYNVAATATNFATTTINGFPVEL